MTFCVFTVMLKLKISIPFADGSSISSMDESPNSSDNAIYAIFEAEEETNMPCSEAPTCSQMPLNADDDSDIEVLLGRNVSMTASAESLLLSAMRWEDDVSKSALFLRREEDGSNQSVINSVGRLESEGAACMEEPASCRSEGFDDYVLLDGYESDVESELSGVDEPQQSL